MSAINETLEAVIGLMNATSPFSTVTRGALPTGVGLSCEIGPSSPSELYLDKNTTVPLDVTLNGKHADLELLSDTMNNIHYALTHIRTYPSGAGWQIIDIQNMNLPQIIGREQNNEWLMASALSVRFFWKGE